MRKLALIIALLLMGCASVPVRQDLGMEEYSRVVKDKVDGFARGNFKNQGSGKVLLQFTILEDGKLGYCAVDESQSTTNKTLKMIALRSLKEASPFARFPEGYQKEKIDLKIEIVFDDSKYQQRKKELLKKLIQ